MCCASPTAPMCWKTAVSSCKGPGVTCLPTSASRSPISGSERMITDVHCHFIPPEYFSFVQRRPEFEVTVRAQEGETIPLMARGGYYGLNPTFFEPARQIALMDELGIERSVISLATPLVNYYVEPSLALEAARL